MRRAVAVPKNASYRNPRMLIKSGLMDTERDAFREIFFLSSSRKNFASPEEKEAFFKKWTDYYLCFAAHLIMVAKDNDGRLLGYLTGCADSRSALSYFAKVNPSYSLFADQFQAFPAHFHINCHPDARGKGVGSQLVNHFIENLNGIHGAHIVTSPDAENRHFYRKNGFTHELIREWKGIPLLFMGRKWNA